LLPWFFDGLSPRPPIGKLALEEGAVLVLLGKGVNVTNFGSFSIGGKSTHATETSSSSSILLPLPGGVFWGGLRCIGETSHTHFTNTFLSDGGNAAGSRDRPDHRFEQAVLSASSGAFVHLVSTVMTGGAGRGLDIENSTLVAINIAVHDMLSGGTLNNSDVLIHGSNFAEFAFQPNTQTDDDRLDLGKFDDNDALYIAGGSVRIVDTVIIRAGDDCIDAGSEHYGWVMYVSFS
jgi:hypothetical protein